MIRRTLEKVLKAQARQFPVVTLTGPRQSGKTTLCKTAFPKMDYVSLEIPETRDYALKDPRGFLAQFKKGAILDEVQRAPDLLSYIQVEVDEKKEMGRYVLTGSQHFNLRQSLSQSLAGRTALLDLLPFDHQELSQSGSAPKDLFMTLWKGGYPVLYDRKVRPQDWLASYLATYVERDVRLLLNIGDLLAFQTFLGLCAGRIGQLLNLSDLGSDGGINHNTAKSWISVLEASYIVFRLQPLHRNINKRLIKTPKLYFYDTGLLCYLLGIRTPDDLAYHPLRGSIFENWVISETLKIQRHHGITPRLFFLRDRKNFEIDLVSEQTSGKTMLIEVKSGQTISQDMMKTLDSVASDWKKALGTVGKILVYGGEHRRTQSDIKIYPWFNYPEIVNSL